MSFLVRERKTLKDEFGPEHVYEVFDSEGGVVLGWCVIDNTARSPTGVGKGGTAMYPGCNLEITCTKARVMTFKQVFCVPMEKTHRYVPWGGAKGGIRFDSSRASAKEILGSWAQALNKHGVIPHQYIFGLDVGLDESAARIVVDELGSNNVATGKPRDLGGIPYDELGITGYGLALAMKPMAEARHVDMFNPKTRIAIQGFGSVGYGTACWLEQLYPGGAKIVAVSDKQGMVFCDRGLLAREYKDIFSRPLVG